MDYKFWQWKIWGLTNISGSFTITTISTTISVLMAISQVYVG